MKIYLDMDGVLADFERRYLELFGERPADTRGKNKHFWKNWGTFVSGKNFETLELHPNALELIQHVESLNVPIEILSSSGGFESHEDVVDQKLKWLSAQGITYKPNIVPGSAIKARYAKPWHVLIDDTAKVIDKYREAGGPAIHHVRIEDTLEQLDTIYTAWKISNDKSQD